MNNIVVVEMAALDVELVVVIQYESMTKPVLCPSAGLIYFFQLEQILTKLQLLF